MSDSLDDILAGDYTIDKRIVHKFPYAEAVCFNYMMDDMRPEPLREVMMRPAFQGLLMAYERTFGGQNPTGSVRIIEKTIKRMRAAAPQVTVDDIFMFLFGIWGVQRALTTNQRTMGSWR